MAFPIIKLFILSGKLVAKMVSKNIKRQVGQSEKMIETCYTTVNKYNQLEAIMRSRITGRSISPRYMSKDETIVFFTDFFGELVVFGTVTGFVLVEYIKTDHIDADHVDKLKDRIKNIENKLGL